MKKKLLILWTICFWLFSYSHAQSLWDISLSFCSGDQKEQMDIITQSDIDTEICVEYQNNSNKDITLDINFVDWALNASGWKSCNIPEDQNDKFTKYMKEPTSEITIPWNSTKKENYTIRYPIWYEWISHGCITYNIKSEEEWNPMINFVFRKAFSIDILVWWSEVKPKLDITNIYITWYDTAKQLVLELKNKWNIDQEINLTWTIENLFWYSESFEITGITISANQNLKIISNEILIPSYKWFFTIKSYLTNNPIFDFDITNTNLETEYSTAWLTIITNNIMLWNRLYIVLIIIVIALIISLSINHHNRKKTKKSKKK